MLVDRARFGAIKANVGCGTFSGVIPSVILMAL